MDFFNIQTDLVNGFFFCVNDYFKQQNLQTLSIAVLQSAATFKRMQRLQIISLLVS